jgi:hypothetical protein
VTVICCFCGDALDDAWATTMDVRPPRAEDESQRLYCHGRCLVAELHPSVPHHPSIDDA